jgi:hypothetical protein
VSDQSDQSEQAEAPPKQYVDVPLQRVCCARHGEPFRAKWPAGYLPFALMGIEYLLQQDGYFQHDLAKLQEGGADHRAAMEQLLDRKPVCCRLPSRVLLQHYMRAGCFVAEQPVFTDAKCFNCRKVGAGGPYRIAHPGGTVQEIPHVCLRCVVYYMEPARKSGEVK